MVYDRYFSNNKHDTFIHLCVKESVIDKEVHDLSNRIFNANMLYSHGFNSEIEQVVNYVRTIFRNYNETGLVVHVKSKNNYSEVTIKNGQIIKFNNNQIKDYGVINFDYSETGINMSCNNSDLNEINDINNDLNSLFNKSMDIINNLNKNNIIELSSKDKELINIYKLFFNKYPDFSNIEDYSKVQSMMWILSRYNIGVEEYGDYTIRYSGLPQSFNLKTSVEKIKLYGNNTKEFEYEIDDKILIQNIGKIVNNYINTYKDSQEILDNISLVSYITNRLVSKYYEISDIINVSDRLNYEQAEEIDDFLKNLDSSLVSSNPFETFKELNKENKENTKVKR